MYHINQQIQLKIKSSTNRLAIWKVCIFLLKKMVILKISFETKHNFKKSQLNIWFELLD